jgi:hypothetical protein
MTTPYWCCCGGGGDQPCNGCPDHPDSVSVGCEPGNNFCDKPIHSRGVRIGNSNEYDPVAQVVFELSGSVSVSGSQVSDKTITFTRSRGVLSVPFAQGGRICQTVGPRFDVLLGSYTYEAFGQQRSGQIRWQGGWNMNGVPSLSACDTFNPALWACQQRGTLDGGGDVGSWIDHRIADTGPGVDHLMDAIWFPGIAEAGVRSRIFYGAGAIDPLSNYSSTGDPAFSEGVPCVHDYAMTGQGSTLRTGRPRQTNTYDLSMKTTWYCLATCPGNRPGPPPDPRLLDTLDRQARGGGCRGCNE